MKFLVIASKDIKMHLKSPKFIFSLFLSSLAIIGLKILFDHIMRVGVVIPPIFLMDIIFTLSLPCLGLALLFLNADILAKERSEGTILILFSQPVSNISIITGKFVAILFSGIVYSSVNTLLLKILYAYIFKVTGFVSESQLIASFFLTTLIFQLPIIGLTLLFSSIFRRSATVTIIVILAYEALAILYSSQLILRLPAPFAVGHELIQIFTIMLGSILGYIISLGWLIPLPGFAIEEPPVIKYLPINVNAQRLFHFLISPSPKVEMSDVVISIFSLIAITIITFSLSLLLLKKARSEYLD